MKDYKGKNRGLISIIRSIPENIYNSSKSCEEEGEEDENENLSENSKSLSVGKTNNSKSDSLATKE
jgi:hypothetical protein